MNANNIPTELSPSVYELLCLFCSNTPAPEAVAAYFDSVEFEALRPEVSCLAASVAAAGNYAGAPEALVPRLRGILRYAHTLNAGRMAGMYALTKILNLHGIRPLLLQDTALRVKYPGALRRHMWQAELAVSEEDYPEALRYIRETDFTLEEHLASVILRRGTTECIILYRYGEDRCLWEGAEAFSAGGAEFLMPHDDMLLLAYAEYACHCMRLPDLWSRVLRWTMDVHPMLCRSDTLNWDNVVAAAGRRGLSRQVRLLLETYGLFTPEGFPEDVPDRLCSKAAADGMRRLLDGYRTTDSKLKRMWLGCCLANPDQPAAAVTSFSKKLLKSFFKRLSRQSGTQAPPASGAAHRR